jgi:hypothetical protein
MKQIERIEGNELIADFLCWEKRIIEAEHCIVYRTPNNIQDKDSGWFELEPIGFLFDSDWNWFMTVWDELHRKALIPILKDNQHLRRELSEMIKDMRNCLKWAHIEGAYKVLIKLITWYNNQFE